MGFVLDMLRHVRVTEPSARSRLEGDGVLKLLDSPKNIIIDFDLELRPVECTGLFFSPANSSRGSYRSALMTSLQGCLVHC